MNVAYTFGEAEPGNEDVIAFYEAVARAGKKYLKADSIALIQETDD